MPAVRFEAVAEEPPPPDQAYVYVPVPPVAEAVAEPSLSPLQLTFVGVPIEATSTVGSVRTTEAESVQPPASVIVTE